MEKREPLPENASRTAVARASESTPEQALRKMKAKVNPFERRFTKEKHKVVNR